MRKECIEKGLEERKGEITRSDVDLVTQCGGARRGGEGAREKEELIM